MPRRHLLAATALALVMAAGAWTWSGRATATPAELPARLSSEAFRELTDTLSEHGGFFRSDNLVSNELTFQHVIPELRATIPQGGVYLGVGPDQNFTYVAALRPALALVVDIRRENQIHHLVYKALFELAETRAAFVAQLFARPAPELSPDAGPDELFAAFATVAPDDRLANETAARIEARVASYGIPLGDADRDAIRRVLAAFVRHGPGLTYASTSSAADRGMPTFAELQRASDLRGDAHGYLASPRAYAVVRRWQMANLIVPVVGDFAGEHALGAIAALLEARGARVSAFYASNVEEYLFGDGRWPAFYANLERLPRTAGAVLIRATSGSSRLDPMTALLADVRDGRIRTYADITGRVGVR